MPRGNKHNKHRARGGGHGRGRGRGAPHRAVPTTPAPPTAAASSAPRYPYPHTNAEFDVVIQQWQEQSTVDVPVHSTRANGGRNVNRGNGNWRGGTPKSRSGVGTPLRGTDSPGRGASTPRRRGRGRGRGRGWGPDDEGVSSPGRPHLGTGGKARAILGKDAPLSDLLYATRPLLRPVKFVRATLTPFLFQHSEDVLKPAAELADTTDASHVPTTDRVSRFFHKGRTWTGATSDSGSDSEDHAQSSLEEIDFADMTRVRAEIDAIAQSAMMSMMDPDARKDEEDIEEVDFADLAAMRAKVDAAELQTASRNDPTQEVSADVYDHIKDTTHVWRTTDIVRDDQPSGAQQMAPLSASPTLDDSLNLKTSIGISTSNLSHLESHTVVVEDEVPGYEVPCSSKTTLPRMPVEEASPSTAPETYPAPIDIPLHPDTPSHDDPNPLFVVDTSSTRPFSGRSTSEVILVDRAGYGECLGDQDEECIVYVAPHPRSRRASPVPAVPRAELPQTSMLTRRPFDSDVGGLRSPVREDDAGPTMLELDRTRVELEAEAGEDHLLSLASLTIGPTTSAALSKQPPRANAALGARKKQARNQRQNKQSRLRFGAYGAMMSEARLREEDVKEKQRPRWETRRRGDSDVDWGTEDGEEDEDQDGMGDSVDAVSDGLGGMEIDPDLELDVDAMRGFLKGMSAEGSRFMTMDEIEDEARLRREDEEGQGGPVGSSGSEGSEDEDTEVDGDEEEVFNAEEEVLIAESESDEELSEDSDDDELEYLPQTRGADDEAFIAHINDLIEENSQILSSRDRKQKNAIFRHLHEGYVDVEALQDDPEFTTPVNKKKKKKKGKDIQATTGYVDPELQARWARDRAKKAALKQERQTARYLAALDPLSVPAGARSSRKAMRAAARLDPDAMRAITPRAVVDMVSLEAQMRRFVEGRGVDSRDGDTDANKNGSGSGASRPRNTMALPPMESWMRKRVHELAAAFGIKSVSKGKGAARYTTLVRTKRTGMDMKEGRVRALMKRYGGSGGGRGAKGGGGGGGGRGAPRHREGDEVGKEAPKIGESNIGFRMLASMGWQEGDRIGGTASVGIEAPLTAVIKNSKLGLGATR